MSIDPAARVVDLPTSIRDFGSLVIDTRHVFAFDFDGVISSSLEDDIYHLDTWDGEDEILGAVARALNVNCSSMELKYQRHLLYQASAFKLGIDIEPGPAFDLIKTVSPLKEVFVLTARSGWYAVERMRKFLYRNDIVPLEVFNIGRTTKDRQITLLSKEFHQKTLVYVEDNNSHLLSAHSLGIQNLELFLVERTPKLPSDQVKEIILNTLHSAVRL